MKLTLSYHQLEMKTMKEHHYDFKLIQELKNYVDYFDSKDFNWAEADRRWQKEIGLSQRFVPAHIANEYCRTDSSFDPTPIFDAQVPFENNKRSLDLYRGKFFPLDSDPLFRLGVDSGIYKAGAYAAHRVSYCMRGVGAQGEWRARGGGGRFGGHDRPM